MDLEGSPGGNERMPSVEQIAFSAMGWMDSGVSELESRGKLILSGSGLGRIAQTAAFIVLFGLRAQSQAKGTIVVFELTDHALFIAADSQVNFENSPPKYDQCKVGTLDQDSIFAMSGATGYYPIGQDDLVSSWDSLAQARLAAEDARKASPPRDAAAAVDAIADNWSRRIEAHWDTVMLSHPERVQWAVGQEGRTLANAIFAVGRGRKIAVSLRSVVVADGAAHVVTLPTDSLCTPKLPCGTGETKVFYEFTRKTSLRSRREPKQPTPLLEVIRLVDLSLAYDTSGTIGGKIDALELDDAGQVTWYQRKENCR
jgi:hypothetical protein